MKSTALESIVFGRNIKYKVTFPLQHTIPKLTKILYNDQLICSGNPEPGYVTTIKLEHTIRTSTSGFTNYHIPAQHQESFSKPGAAITIANKTSSNVIELEIFVHPNGELVIGPSTTTIVPNNGNLHGISDRYEHLGTEISSSTTESSTTQPSSTSQLSTMKDLTTHPYLTSHMATISDFPNTVSTGTPVKPMKPGSLDDLLEQLYGSNSDFVQKSSSSLMTTPTTER